MSPHYEDAMWDQFAQDVQDGVDAVLEAEGYVDADGNPHPDVAKERIAEAVIATAVVSAKSEKTKKALTRGKLYQLAFATGPGSDASLAEGGPSVDDLPRLERHVYERLASLAWDLTQAGRSGYIQRHLERNDSSLVLCRVTIHMPRDKATAAYVTDNETLIMEDAVDKEIASMFKRVRRLRGDLDMIVRRHDGLRGPIGKHLAIEMRKIEAELTLEPPAVPETAVKQLAAGAA